MLANNQRDQGLKFELLVPVNSAEKPTACLSFNYHQDHFGSTWEHRAGRRRRRAHGLRRLRPGADHPGAASATTASTSPPGRRPCARSSGARAVPPPSLAALRPAEPAFAAHPLHDADREWPETNCYVDLWIELLHARGLEPEAMLGFTLRQDFEGDQFTFFKPPLADLEALYGAAPGGARDLRQCWSGMSRSRPRAGARCSSRSTRSTCPTRAARPTAASTPRRRSRSMALDPRARRPSTTSTMPALRARGRRLRRDLRARSRVLPPYAEFVKRRRHRRSTGTRCRAPPLDAAGPAPRARAPRTTRCAPSRGRGGEQAGAGAAAAAGLPPLRLQHARASSGRTSSCSAATSPGSAPAGLADLAPAAAAATRPRPRGQGLPVPARPRLRPAERRAAGGRPRSSGCDLRRRLRRPRPRPALRDGAVARLHAVDGRPARAVEGPWQLVVTAPSRLRGTRGRGAWSRTGSPRRCPARRPRRSGRAGLWSEAAPTPIHGSDVWYRCAITLAGRETPELRRGWRRSAEIWIGGVLRSTSRSMFLAHAVEVEASGTLELALCFRALQRRTRPAEPARAAGGRAGHARIAAPCPHQPRSASCPAGARRSTRSGPTGRSPASRWGAGIPRILLGRPAGRASTARTGRLEFRLAFADARGRVASRCAAAQPKP